MTSCVFLLVSVLVATVTADLRASAEPPGARPPPAAVASTENGHGREPALKRARCHDRGESAGVRVLEGEATWLRCPLFRQPSLSNLSSSGDPLWYRLLPGQHLEPITHSARLSKEDDMLCFQPAVAEDAGRYVCQLRHRSECVEMAASVSVVRRPRAAPEGGRECDLPVAVALAGARVPLQGGDVLDCPDWREARQMADAAPVVTWYHECEGPSGWTSDRQQAGARLELHYMLDHYQGVYRCQVRYRRAGRALRFTRGVNVTAVSPSFLPKEPSILQPTAEHVFGVKLGSDVRLVCRGHFPYLDSANWSIWWSVDGYAADQLADPRFSASNRHVRSDHGDRIEESALLIRDFASEDLGETYDCSVRNRRGFRTRRARLEEEASAPSPELACGLAVTLALSLALLALYRVFRLELLLLYRSRFHTDERHTDSKDFDVYISYARNSEEEKFVLGTLRRVLENHLGYSVCIFDRDSLPGGTITDETLRFVARSRRLALVPGPGYARRGSQGLLELKAGVDGLAGGHLRLILIQYEPVRRQEWVRELRRARVALATVRWRGERSRESTSRFWKKLRLELPVRRPPGTDRGEEAGLMRTANRRQSDRLF
ncbi:interleukin-1 receptor accessory protein-like isoform X2 [Phycodurus eques]|uniref:interleukin-1 receptor accessory protein-like isoform X2 n=1 Tax=Phycodurus eques TaxID=693459 RepID=UPI002ACE5A2E|nr:interleukin-1 receptor accessory protein-like isoform X2 [Phycodurus eques]